MLGREGGHVSETFWFMRKHGGKPVFDVFCMGVTQKANKMAGGWILIQITEYLVDVGGMVQGPLWETGDTQNVCLE